MSNATKKCHILCSETAAAIKDSYPTLNIPAQKLAHIICTQLGTNPVELDLLLRLHEKFQPAQFSTGIVGVFYNCRKEKADIALFSYTLDGKVSLLPKHKYDNIDLLGNGKTLKKQFKAINKYAIATGRELCWLASDSTTLEAAAEFCQNTIKRSQPRNCIQATKFMFAEEQEPTEDLIPKLNLMGNIATVEAQLGIVMVTHCFPYLPLNIDYYVGNVSKKNQINRAIDKSRQPLSLGMGKLEESWTMNGSQEPASIPLKTRNLFSYPYSKTQILFDILDSSLEHDFENIKASYNYKSKRAFQRNEEQSVPLQALITTMKRFKGGKLVDFDQMKNPQKYKSLEKGFKFNSDTFSITSGYDQQTQHITRESQGQNLLEKALELQSQLLVVRSIVDKKELLQKNQSPFITV